MSYAPFQPQDAHEALRSAGAAYGSCGHPRQLDVRGGALPCATLGELLGAAAVAVRPRELVYRREQVQTTEGLKFLWRKAG